MKNLRKSLAVLLVVVLLGQLVLGVLPALAASDGSMELTGHSFHSEGLWLTEIYPNDVDRSTANDTRAKDGCVPVTTYGSTSDMMEFLELMSTHEADFQFNDVYALYYNSRQLSVTDLNGSSHITVKKGQPIVIWNERLDVTDGDIPSAATFIKEMHIPDNALVLKTSGGGWDPAATFSLKLKSTGATFCSFTPVSDVDVRDGLSVELKMPFWKSETAMEIYARQNIPSPGYVYHDQVRGYITANVPDDYNGGVFITELRPDDSERRDAYGTGSDYFECLEIANTTDKAVDLNKDLKLLYTYKESSRKLLPLYQYSSGASNRVGSSTGCTVPAGGVAVIWCYRYDYLNATSTKFPTLTDLRSAYGIPANVPVYLYINQNSMNDTYRGFELYTTNGVNAKYLGDTQYFRAFAKQADGSYVYSKMVSYSALDYAKSVLSKSNDVKLKQLVVAMLNYGAEAQKFFGYKTDDLMNKDLTADDQALLAGFDASSLNSVGKVDASKIGAFGYTGGFTRRTPAISFKGAFEINYFFTPANAVDGDMTLYFWNEDTYNSVSELTADNADKAVVMTLENGSYTASSDEIAAKYLDKTVYVAAVYESDGVTYCSGVLPYSIAAYCQKPPVSVQALANAAAIYGCTAKQFFGV